MNNTLIIDTLETKFKDCVLRKLIGTEEDNIIRIISRFESLGYYSLALLSEAVEIKKDENISYLNALKSLKMKQSFRNMK